MIHGPHASWSSPAERPADDGRDPMLAVRVRLSVLPSSDAQFIGAVEDAWKQVCLSRGIVLGTRAGAAMAEAILHAAGFPAAKVYDARTRQDATGRSAHWRVLRDGASPGRMR